MPGWRNDSPLLRPREHDGGLGCSAALDHPRGDARLECLSPRTTWPPLTSGSSGPKDGISEPGLVGTHERCPLRREEHGELVVDDFAASADGEVGGDEPPGSGELTLAADHLPDHGARSEE